MLELILGLDETACTALWEQEIGTRRKADAPSWILVPEQFSLYTEKEILLRFGLSAQRQVKVLSFSRLCNLVLRHKGPLRMQYIDGAGKQILAARTMELMQGKLTVLEKNLKQKGFAKVLADTVSECKRYGVPPQVLRFGAEKTLQEDLKNKLYDLADLYEAYDGLLTAQNADAEDNLSLICDRLRDCDFLTGKLYVMHFRSFTPVEYRALGELMGRMDVAVFLQHSKDPAFGGLFAPIDGAIRKLKELAEEQGIKVAEPNILPLPQEDSALTYFANHYFDPRAKEWAGETTPISVYEVQNTYGEMEAAADLILRLCRTKGYRFSDFLILARSMEPYQRMMPAVFEQRGVRVFLDTRRSIAEKPLARLLCGILEILAYGYSYERTMELAGCGLLEIEKSAMDELENYILATAPTHAMWNAETWDYQPGRGDFDMERINQTRQILFSGVKAMEDAISGTKTGGEIAEALLSWMKEGVADTITQKAQTRLEQGAPELADEYVQVWNGVLSVLTQISAYLKDTPMTYRKFSELFANALNGIEIGMTPQTLDCVTFSQIDRFRNNQAKVVLVLGMNEGVFPQGYLGEGLLSDNERSMLLDLGIALAPGKESKQKEEQLLIYAVLSAPKQALYFFRPVMEKDGKRQVPSGILKRAKELLPQMETVMPQMEPFLGGAEGGDAIFDRLAAAMAEFGGEVSLLPKPLRELYESFWQKEGYRGKLQELTRAMSAKPPKELSEELVKALYGETLSLSASQLESFNGCAFRYFLNYGLMLREREIAGLEPRSKGSIQHAALYEYFTALKEQNVDFATIEKEDCFYQVGQAVENEAKKNAELLYEASAYYQYIVMQMKGIAARTAWEVVKFYRSSSFRPYGFEITIGTRGEIPALSVKSDAGKEIARIRGIIDRADTAKVGEKTLVNVVDYKSSAKGLDVKLAEDGITLQPLLYAHALCAHMENAQPAGLMYLQMNDPVIPESKAKKNPELAINKEMRPQGWLLDEAAATAAYGPEEGKDTESFRPSNTTAMVSGEELEKRIANANAKIQKAAEGIAKGEIGADPYRSYQYDACEYCNYRDICKQE